MIPLPGIRDKGGAPHLGAKGPHQRGPFGGWPDPDEDDLDDDQDDGPVSAIPDTDH